MIKGNEQQIQKGHSESNLVDEVFSARLVGCYLWGDVFVEEKHLGNSNWF